MIRVEVMVNGLSPLLMNNPQGMKIRGIGPKTIPTPEEEAERSTYKLSDGTLYVPTIAVRSSIIAAAGPFKIGRMSLKTVLAGIIRAIEPEECIPLMRNGKTISEYEIDIRRVVVQGQGVLRARARIDLPWSLSFIMHLDEMQFRESDIPVMEEVINRAGVIVGLLDFRPGSPKNKIGWFGKYEVGKFEKLT